MTYIEATLALLEGKKIRRTCWNKFAYLIFDGEIKMVVPEVEPFKYYPDVLGAKDWEIIEDGIP